MKLRLLGNRVAVRPEKAQETSEGGIHLIVSDGKPIRGVVVSVGPGVYDDKDGTFTDQCIRVGETIMYVAGAGDEIEFAGETLIVLVEDLVVGRVV